MEYIFRLSGETPSKKNSRVTNRATGRSFPNKRFTDWHKNALVELLPQKLNYNLSAPLCEPLEVVTIFTHGDQRRRDGDNGESSIMDLLTDAGILIDDNNKIVLKQTPLNRYEKNNAHCIIIIKTGLDTAGEIEAIYNKYK